MSASAAAAPPRAEVLSLAGWRDPLDLLEASRGRRGVALLASAGGGASLSRFSLLVADPYLTLRWRDGRAELSGPDGQEAIDCRDPFELLAGRLGGPACPAPPPWPFAGGAVGHFAYDAARALERLPSTAADDRGFPAAEFALYAWAICWDHALGRWAALSTGAPSASDPARTRRARALCERAAAWAASAPAAAPPAPPRRGGSAIRLSASLARRGYLEAVEAIRRRIAEGDCYEVNLTRRLTARARPDPRAAFAALCRENPAPFAAYIEGGSSVLVGSSPERFLRVGGGRAESRPIKGTARRSSDPAEDAARAERLRRSEKDRAENVMIVDLVRNDLGRVCRPGSVRAEGVCELESYAGVHHLVSTVAGRLLDGAGALDAARALFPPGSMTGAPKIRAMEVIEALEPIRRGPYAGAAGYVASGGDADLAVVIRTLVLSEAGVDLQAGGAVVADSAPEAEFAESAAKAARALRALEEALGRPLASADPDEGG